MKGDGDATKEFSVKGSVTGRKSLTFEYVNVSLGNSDGEGTMDVDITELNIAEGNTLTIAGNVNLKSDKNQKFNGVDGKNGEIIINDEKTLTSAGTINFANEQTISGNGTFTINKQITGPKLITSANINMNAGKATTDMAYEVAGGTFTNNNVTDNFRFYNLVVSGGTFVAAVDTRAEVMTVTGGTVRIDKDKTLTVTTGNPLLVDGDATFDGGTRSKLSTDNVDLQEGAMLTIKDTVTLTRPLVVNNNATIKGIALSDTLQWDAETTPKISVATGKTLTIGDTLTLVGNVTLEGQMAVVDTAIFNLKGSNIIFTPTSKFTGTEGLISFVPGVTIFGLKNNPEISAKNLNFAGAVTYDATCVAMFPGNYSNTLTLLTADGNDIAMFDTVKISGSLSWSAGRIVLNGNPLFVKDAIGSGTFGEKHMLVAGKKSKYVFVAAENKAAGDLNLTIPIGTSSLTSSGAWQYSYSPATISINEEVAMGDTIEVQVEDDALNGKATDLRRYWTINSNRDLTGTVTFTYAEADDVMGYGKSAAHYWRVFHGNDVFDGADDPQSPFELGGHERTFSVALDGDKYINGTWTACEWPAAVTLYSFGSGDWNSPDSWTTNSAGSTHEGGRVPDANCDVVILPKDVITGTGAGITARSVMLKNETSTLIIPVGCGVSINNLSGEGKLIIDGSGEFPEGIANTELFMAPGGGTTEFRGSPDGPAATFILKQPKFNNLVINFGKDGEKLQLPNNESHKLIINGSLELTNGTVEYTQKGQYISVAGDINIGKKGSIINSATEGGVVVGGDTLVVGGNLINNGIIRLTRRVWNGYNPTVASQDEEDKGRGILRFVGESNVKFECYDTTNISQLIIDKGSDWTYKVTLDGKKEKVFGLLGRATNIANPEGFANKQAYPANPKQLFKPLWIKAGTLELIGEVHIRSLAEQSDGNNGLDCFYIPAQGCLHLNGDHVKVEVTISDAKSVAYASVIPAGKLIVEKGLFDGKGSSGITFVGTSFIEVRGGTLKGAQFRPSEYALKGITTYIQTGGYAKFDGCGDDKENSPIFYMPEASYTFKMTDGTLEVCSAMKKAESIGSFVVKSNPENGKILGGTIIINTGKAIKLNKNKIEDVSNGNYLIATELPLFNLVLRNNNPDNPSTNYVRHYIEDLHKKVLNYQCDITASTIIQNDLTIEDGVVFDTQGRPVTVGRNLNIESGAIVYTKGGGSTENEFIMNGTGELTVNGEIKDISGSAKEGFYNLTFAEGASVSMKSDITVRGLFKLAERATMNDGSKNKTYTISGDIEIDGTYDKCTSCASKMVIGGENIYTKGTGVLSNVDINAGSELLLSDRTNPGRQTKLAITGKLNFVSETQFNIGGSNLEFGPEAEVVGSFGPTRMIRTVGTSSRGVTKVFAANGEFLFPFGFVADKAYYTPAKIKYTTADTYGSVTSRPVYGQSFRDDNSLKSYWITEERGFSGASLTQYYYWYDATLSEGATDAWVPARRNGSIWEMFGSNMLELDDPNNRHIYFDPSVKSATGYYTCGLPESFESTGTPLYTSNVVADTLDWFGSGVTWSESPNGDPCNCIPSGNTPVYIGDGGEYNRNVKIAVSDDYTGPKAECASLNIAPGSTLDITNYSEFKSPIVDVDESVGAGKLRLSSDKFPEGDFGKFNGEFGGTIEYYGKGYAIPTASIDGSALTNYRNLIISGGASGSDSISMPACGITVFDSVTISGRVCTNPTGDYTININKNLIIAEGGQFEVFDDGTNHMQTIKVGDSLIVANGATMIANGTTPNTTLSLLQIGGSLIVDGTINGNRKIDNATFYKFNTEFVGNNDAEIKSNVDMTFNMLTCNKNSLDVKLILRKCKKINTAVNNAILTLTKGTLVVAVEDGQGVDLSNNADFPIPADACLHVISGNANVANHTYKKQLLLSGHIVVDGGVLRIGKEDGSVHNDILYAPDGKPSITINGGKLYVNGQISRQLIPETGSLIWKQTNGDVVIYGNERPTTENLRGRGAFEVLNDGEFDMSGGTITVMTGGGEDQYGDILIDPATMKCTGGTIIASNGSLKIRVPHNMYNLEVANGATLNAYTALNVNELKIDNSGVFNALDHNLTIRKAFKNYNNQNGSGISEGFNYGTSAQLTTFVGSDMTYEGINASATQFNTLEIDGDLNMVKGHSDMRVGGNLTQNSGTVTDNGNVISLYGNLVYYGNFVGSGGIDFCRGDGDVQYIDGNGMGSIGTVIVSNTSEVYLNNSPFRITNKIILGSSLYINRNNVILIDTATVEVKDGVFDGNHMIRLNGEHEDAGVTKYVKKNKSEFTIPVGILHNGNRYYTPAIYEFKSNSGTNVRSITVKTINSRHKNLTYEPSYGLDYYWNVATDGFGEDGSDNFSSEIGDYEVTQKYVYPESKMSGTKDTLFPEYLYYGGTDEYKWIDLRAKKGAGSELAYVAKDSVIFKPFGHIAGDYTVGVVGTTAAEDTNIYTARPVLYTGGNKKGGEWDNPKTWYNKDGVSLFDEMGGVVPENYKIDGNPVHILPGDTVYVKRSGTKAYSLTFEDGEELGVLNIGNTVGSDFGRVNGVGHLVMTPVSAATGNYYKMPAGNFRSFLTDERSIIEFAGGSGKLPNEIVGHVSMPLQNVILSGGGTKTLTKESGEYINKSMTIRNNTTLAFGNTPIYIKGDWIDENTGASGGFLPGTNNSRSIVEFNGTSRQKIVLSGDNESFYILKINNPSDVEIVKAESAAEAGITINKSLEFVSGCLVDTAPNTSVTLARTITSVSTANSARFVAGPLKWNLKSGDSRKFPVGTIDKTAGKVYAPTNVNGVTKDGNYTVTFYSGVYSYDVVWPFTSMSNTEKWTVTAPDNANAKLGLRVGSRTFASMSSSMLKRVKIAGNNDVEWEPIASSHSGGSLPEAMITTTAAINLSDYSEYTLGSSNSTARLWNTTDENTTFDVYICDGDYDATEIPVYFTGMGGPYKVNYKITDKEKGKSVTIASPKFTDNVGSIAITGSELAAKFGRSDGYSDQAYEIEITGMTDNNEDGMPAGGNKVDVYVLYNAKPDIDGAGTVGMGDVRVYTTTASDKVDIYEWSSNTNKATIAPTDNTANVTFGTNASTYNVTLTVKNTYIESHGKSCYRENSKVVKVDENPQPEIKGNFGICRSNRSATFSTDKVGTHTYEWNITNVVGGSVGDITLSTSGRTAENNEVTLTWGAGFAGTKATLEVTEENSGLTTTVERVITFYDDVELGETTISSPDVCDNTIGTVTISNTNVDYLYSIFQDETALCDEFGGSSSEPTVVTTSEPLRYSTGNLNFTVIIKNKGCQKELTNNEITVHEKPAIDDFTIDDNDLFKGNLVQIDYTKTSVIGLNNYEFAYSVAGVKYRNDEVPANLSKTVATPMVIRIPDADRMKGTLTISSNDNVLSCTNTYEIDKPISEAYLWSGGGNNTNWDNADNWWVGTAPNSDEVDVVIRKDKKITLDGGREEDNDISMPTVNAAVSVRNIKVESGADVNVDNTLTINKDVVCNGSFAGTGTVAFTSGSHTVSGAGTFANLSNEGTVTASDAMTVTGNIANNGSFAGTIALNGSSTQTVGGGNFEDVTVNSSGVTIDNSINIGGKLTLTKGIISVGDGQALVFTNGAKDVVGGGAKAYVDGTMWKYGKTPFVFPTGNNGRLAKIGITPGTDATDATYYSASYALDAGKAPLTSGLSAGMSRVSQAETWLVDCPGGKSSKLTLYWSDAEASGITPGKESDLVVAHFTEGKWKAEPAKFDGVNSISTTSYVTSYSPFTFGAKNPEPDINPLPVTFAAFTGRQAGNSIVLEWTTLSEKDNDYFEIERSIDGVNFVTIGYVDGAGNSNSLLNYQFADNAPEQGQLYYRLSQVDFDGTREYADKIVTVLYAGDDFDQLTIVPNPTHGLFRVSASGSMAGGRIELLSQSGMVIRIIDISSFDATVDISDLPSGIYVLRLVTDTKILQQKVVKY
ncbi:MAG: T9SS type A sorting domain-containing protein [Salinivirgaceae bacterium]|nr:T9SS type A sorting domain-containing protein [Salinivirgaceae bacterium]